VFGTEAPSTCAGKPVPTDVGRILLAASDNGCGIEVSDLPHVFEPF
jgi:signal transduction histidine kinase